MASAGTPIAGVDSSVESIATDVELVDGASPATEDQGTEGTSTEVVEGQEPSTTEGQQPDVKEDGRLIPQSLRGLKESNPEAYKVAKAAFFETRQWRETFPTIQAAKEASTLLKSVGGKEGITQLRGDAQVFKTAAQQFLKGDVGFVKDLWEEDPIAAALHVAPMLDELRTHDRDSYNATVTKMWDSEFEAVGMTAGLANLKAAIEGKNVDGALAILKSITDWKDSITGLAKKAEDPRVKTLLAERAKARDTEATTKQQGFLKDYRTETINEVAGEGNRVFDSFFRGIKLDPSDRNDLLRDALKLANSEVEKDKTFAEQRDAHLASGDAVSARELTLARYKQFLPDAVKRIARRYGYVSGKPAQGGTPPNKTNPGTPGVKVEQGWMAVKQRPAAEDIDRGRTSNDMILSGKAILRDGKKVDWSALKKQ